MKLRTCDTLHAGWNTAVYFLSCVPASLNDLYKERAMMEYRQPIDPYYFNFNINLYQLLLLVPLTPIAYKLQNAGWVSHVP